MNRYFFLIISILSAIYGLMFLIIPGWFIDLSLAQHINVAWLRSIGASIVGLLIFGCLLISLKPNKKLALLKIIRCTSALQTTSLIFSRYLNEFSATNLILIDLTIIIAVVVTIYFIYTVIFQSDYFE